MTKEQFQHLVDEYIESKTGSWSEATMKSERSRLRNLEPKFLTDPKALYECLKHIRGLKPYAIKTTFIRVGELAEYAIEAKAIKDGKNKVKEYLRAQANLFKGAYKPKVVSLTWEEALSKIQGLEYEEDRKRALELLFTGMRWNESENFKDGQVKAKGGDTRNVSLARGIEHVEYASHYTTFYRALKKVGLTPHMLRKLAATKATEQGADVADLMARFGWKSAQTAFLYVQSRKQKELDEKLALLVPQEGGSNANQVSKKVRKGRNK